MSADPPLDARGVLALALRTLRNPAEVADDLIRRALPPAASWLYLMLIAVLSGILAWVLLGMFAALPGAPPLAGATPVSMALAQAITLALMALGIWAGGRLAGGEGRLGDAVLLVAWVQGVLMVLQLAQIVLMVVFPLLAQLVGFAGIAIMFWLLSVFAARLHGFASAVPVFFALLFGAFMLAGILRVILGLFNIPALEVL